MNNEWIGVDLDGTLALHARPDWFDNIDAPVQAMVDRVKEWLAQGKDVRIVSARACDLEHTVGGVPQFHDYQVSLIQSWCERHIGIRLPVQFWKDYYMQELWDDRAVQVERNTGRAIQDSLKDEQKGGTE